MFCKYRYRAFKKLISQYKEIYIKIESKQNLRELLSTLSEINLCCRPIDEFVEKIYIENVNQIKIFMDDEFIEYRFEKNLYSSAILLKDFESLLHNFTVDMTKNIKFMVAFIYKINQNIEMGSNGVDNYICLYTHDDYTVWGLVNYDYSEKENEKCVFTYEELEKYGFTNIELFEIQEVINEE